MTDLGWVPDDEAQKWGEAYGNGDWCTAADWEFDSSYHKSS